VASRSQASSTPSTCACSDTGRPPARSFCPACRGG